MFVDLDYLTSYQNFCANLERLITIFDVVTFKFEDKWSINLSYNCWVLGSRIVWLGTSQNKTKCKICFIQEEIRAGTQYMGIKDLKLQSTTGVLIQRFAAQKFRLHWKVIDMFLRILYELFPSYSSSCKDSHRSPADSGYLSQVQDIWRCYCSNSKGN